MHEVDQLIRSGARAQGGPSQVELLEQLQAAQQEAAGLRGAAEQTEVRLAAAEGQLAAAEESHASAVAAAEARAQELEAAVRPLLC